MSWNRTILLTVWLAGLAGCGGEETPDPSNSDSASPNQSENAASPDSAAKLPLPEIPTGLCRVYADAPEALVLVDGQPARTATGDWLHPPCEIRVAAGPRTLTLTMPGFQDASKQVSVSEQSEVEFPPLMPAGPLSVVTAAAPLLDAEIGVPIPLDTVNSPGAELDPFLSPDGLALWFAGERGGARGIYVAYRSSPWHEFAEPELLLLSRGPSRPASPSLSADDLSIYYPVPDDARIWSVSRADPLARYDEKEPLVYRTQPDAEWTAAQVLPDGLRAYWVERKGESLAGFAAVRKTPIDRFSAPIEYPLPGLVPMLSDDALRQYEFDGRTLRRWRRSSVSDTFTVAEDLQTLNLSNYVADPARRQFYVTPDEQWLVYCADPAANPDLYLVRLAPQPQWGVAPVGKSIPPKPKVMVANTMPQAGETPDTTKPAAPQERPPLAYSVYSQTWSELVAARKYAEAAALTRKSLDDAALADSRSQLQDDLIAIQDLERFRGLARAALTKMPPGTPFSIGTVRVELVKFENDLVEVKLGMQIKSQPFFELPPTTLALLAESVAERDDPNQLVSIALFQLFDKDPNVASILAKVADQPAVRDRILHHVAGRWLHQANQEFDRGEYSAGFTALERVLQEFPGTSAAEQAAETERGLYRKTVWENVGNRNWTIDADTGQYTAAEGRVENAFLRSPRPLRNFELRFEWKTSGRVGQGGVYFHYGGEGSVFNRAFKIHLAGDVGVAPDQFCSGSLFGREAPTANAARAQSEWNQSRLIVRGPNVVFWLNGQKVLDTLAIDDNLPEEGFILLDGVTGGITYRHVLLLADESAAAPAEP